ncbi:MAG: hypothetical protein V3581_03050 [Candidatus Cardinium sp.]|uniref:hypothetical protein n=1 Tax=Candidatus Cardinium sp. TP TaxID=2961955 RepID=UPI0021AF5890|nr:hypothetical protein [Candidatus Cardinium sp. TP]MCT4697490.1 hypothetical protein [Candidatus Cardinium sp. TP]MDN5246988.1 hypothetical protein [Candidatus Cardinium sp.]
MLGFYQWPHARSSILTIYLVSIQLTGFCVKRKPPLLALSAAVFLSIYQLELSNRNILQDTFFYLGLRDYNVE